MHTISRKQVFQLSAPLWWESADYQRVMWPARHAKELSRKEKKKLSSFYERKARLSLPSSYPKPDFCVVQFYTEYQAGYPEKFAEVIQETLGLIGASSLLGVPALRASWFPGPHEYEPVQKACATLRTVFGKDEQGRGLWIARDELSLIYPSLFWIKRCAPEAPTVLWVPFGMKEGWFFCKHGGLHVFSYEPPEKKRLVRALHAVGFKEIDKYCVTPWEEETEEMEGRRLLL